jgi:hypothetical protein
VTRTIADLIREAEAAGIRLVSTPGKPVRFVARGRADPKLVAELMARRSEVAALAMETEAKRIAVANVQACKSGLRGSTAETEVVVNAGQKASLAKGLLTLHAIAERSPSYLPALAARSTLELLMLDLAPEALPWTPDWNARATLAGYRVV